VLTPQKLGRAFAIVWLCCRFRKASVTWCVAAHYLVPHVGFVVRTRVMCQAGRARAADARGDIVAWLCERAPLWVVVHVCALLRDF
jgi:hypothetical protein